MVHFRNASNTPAWASPRLGGRNSMQGAHVGGRNSVAQVFTTASRDLNAVSGNPGTLISGFEYFSPMPKTCAVYLLLLLFICLKEREGGRLRGLSYSGSLPKQTGCSSQNWTSLEPGTFGGLPPESGGLNTWAILDFFLRLLWSWIRSEAAST